MTWHVHRADRSDTLVEALADQLRAEAAGSNPALLNPFDPIIVAVPTKGVERFIRQRLSHHLGAAAGADDGVCAGVLLPSPSRVVDELLAEVSGADADDDPWRPGALLWQVLAVVEEERETDWARPLARYFGYLPETEPAGPRTALARLIANRFASYQRQRPQLLQNWRQGIDDDGCGTPIPPHQSWQPELYRALTTRISQFDPGQRARQVAEQVRGNPDLTTLPTSVHLFGPTRLAELELQVFAALAQHRAVHLWLPHPSPRQWQALQSLAPSPRASDTSGTQVRNPLLRSLGRDARELQLRLNPLVSSGVDELVTAPRKTSAPAQPLTALHLLQRGFHDDTADDTTQNEPIALEPTDRSIQVHSCHGRGRQVEVVRDLITGLLQDDPSLEPRDIIVMCPDVEEFAPLVLAAFGAAALDLEEQTVGHPGRAMRVKVADRSLRQVNPVLAVVWRLLEFLGGRMSATDVLDLAGMSAIRRRFRFDDDALATLYQWVIASNIRWALTRQDRAAFGLEQVPDGTWAAGLDRLLLGVAMSETGFDPRLNSLPAEGIESLDVDLIGRVYELVHRLARLARATETPAPAGVWVNALTEALDGLTLTTTATAWQRAQADRVLVGILRDSAGAATPLTRDDLFELFADAVAGRATSTSFRTGDLTVASMLPMRSVPHRVVVLMGLDDGALPRGVRLDGDDVLAFDPQVGERDNASEDRQLFLDAILAATDHLIFTYAGADECTGAPRPPAVPLGEVLDELGRRFTDATGGDALRQIVTQHPVQPSDPRNFAVEAPFSFDPIAFRGARAMLAPPVAGPPLVDGLLPTLVRADSDVELDDLVDFFRDPCAYFVRRRLGIQVRDFTTEPEVNLPLSIDSLQEWAIGDRLLRDRLAGDSAAAAKAKATRRGDLPPQHLGQAELDTIAAKVDKVILALPSHLPPPRAEVAETELSSAPDAGGRVLRGAVSQLRGDALVMAQYGKIHGQHLIAAWLKLLALAASDVPIRVALLASPRSTYQLLAPAPDRARQLLKQAVDIFDAGQCEPLPLPPKAALAYAQGRQSQAKWNAAQLEWSGGRFAGECAAPATVLTLGSFPEALRQSTQRGTPATPVVLADEPSWFAQLATIIYGPLVAALGSGR